MINFKKNFTEITIPKERAIYGLFKNETLVYIGSTDDLLIRISHHIYEKRYYKNYTFDSFSYTLINKDKDILSMEAEEILKHQPKWNRIIHSNPTWKSFDWFCRKHFRGRVKEFKKILLDNNIKPPYIFNSTAYFKIEDLTELVEDYIYRKENDIDLGF